MKHIFIINPMAGKTDSKAVIRSAISNYGAAVDFEFYETKCQRDATRFIRDYCTKNPEEEVCFYACGGDGTVNEVASGCVGFENARMSVYPCGSGNDFVKYYGGTDAFLNIKNLLDGTEQKIDIIDCGDDHYSVNVLNFGFDSVVCHTMIEVKRKPVIGGKNAYTTGIIKGLVSGMKTNCVVKVDGEVLNPDGKMLLCTCANGQYVGGAFRCGPASRNDDGMIDVCLVKPLNHIQFVQLMSPYKVGKHLEAPKFKKHIVFRRGKVIELQSKDPTFEACLDGEMLPTNYLKAEIIPAAIRFIVPKGAKAII